MSLHKSKPTSPGRRFVVAVRTDEHSRLNKVSRNIVTVEDPVEYRLPGINQVASDDDHGLGFANALKYIMRQDPDIIMLGEIRDHETAQTAVQAALTGHLLISTLHTNDAIGAIARLNDLGIDAFKIGGALNDRVLLGAESIGWTKEESGVTITSGSLAAVAYMYLAPDGGFFLKGGLGIATLGLDFEGTEIVSESGTAVIIGAGYDIGFGGRFGLTPFGSLVYGSFEDGSTTLFQFGLGVNWY